MSRPKGSADIGRIPPKYLTGDYFLDMLAVVWKRAFQQADTGDEKAQEEIREFFSFEALENVRKQGLIQWIP